MLKNNGNANQKVFVDYVIIAVWFVAYAVCTILFKQLFIKVLPCFVSLFVGILQARANKIGFIIGAINCFIYAIGYYYENLYASVFESLLISMPMQIIAFVLWLKRENKSEKKVRKITKKEIVISIILSAVLYVAFYFVFKYLGNESLVLNNLIFVLSIVVSVYTIMGLVESRYLNLISCVIGLVMWITRIVNDITGITYLLMSLYNIYTVIKGIVIWQKISKEE